MQSGIRMRGGASPAVFQRPCAHAPRRRRQRRRRCRRARRRRAARGAERRARRSECTSARRPRRLHAHKGRLRRRPDGGGRGKLKREHSKEECIERRAGDTRTRCCEREECTRETERARSRAARASATQSRALLQPPRRVRTGDVPQGKQLPSTRVLSNGGEHRSVWAEREALHVARVQLQQRQALARRTVPQPDERGGALFRRGDEPALLRRGDGANRRRVAQQQTLLAAVDALDHKHGCEARGLRACA
eukprot:5090097-Pleurochrysis_carterae.AAC.2